MRIAVLPERYGHVLSPCASIRLHAPLEALGRAGLATVRFLIEPEVEAFRPDVIVWHRVGIRDAGGIDRLRDVARLTGARMVYDLDDHLLGMDQHPEREAYQPMVAAVRASVQAADRVWCSTPVLASLVQPTAPMPVAVMPNVLDPDHWELEERPLPVLAPMPGPLRLLYMGTRTHEEDFALIATVMDRLEMQAPGAFELHLIGVRGNDEGAAPWLRVRGIPGHVGASYPAFVHWLVRQTGFDLGIAPLVDNAFNAGKSPIKVLDYAALGIPAVASRVPAYSELRSGVDCFHADNTVEDWCQTLLALASDPDALHRVREGARARVTRDVFEAGCRRRLDDLSAVVHGTR